MAKTKRKGDKVERGGDLTKVLHDEKFVKAKSKKSDSRIDLGDAAAALVDEKMTNKIMKVVQSQAKEELVTDEAQKGGMAPMTWNALTGEQNAIPQTLPSQLEEENDIDPIIEAEDEKALEMFFTSSKADRGIDLNKMIRERLGLVNEMMPEEMSQDGDIAQMPQGSKLRPELISMFTHVGQVMSQYRSGKFPKAFKEIPNLRDWEEALWLTRPEKWSAASLYQATRTFAASMSESMAQRFYNLVLLPRVRDDIAFYGKLNFHIYEAIMKAVFKPIAFLRGFLLPLCTVGNCTLKEATIICAIIRDKSIPLQHTSVALLKIAEMEYNGSNSLFLRTMIEKKYALPFRVVDALVGHFIRFKDDTRQLPVLWHQAYYSFVKIYGKDCSEDQKRAMLILTKKQKHREISAEIRRIVLESCPRDIEIGTGDDMTGVF